MKHCPNCDSEEIQEDEDEKTLLICKVCGYEWSE